MIYLKKPPCKNVSNVYPIANIKLDFRKIFAFEAFWFNNTQQRIYTYNFLIPDYIAPFFRPFDFLLKEA